MVGWALPEFISPEQQGLAAAVSLVYFWILLTVARVVPTSPSWRQQCLVQMGPASVCFSSYFPLCIIENLSRVCSWHWPSTLPEVPLASELSTLRVQHAVLSCSDGLAWDLETLVLGQIWFLWEPWKRTTQVCCCRERVWPTAAAAAPWDMPLCFCWALLPVGCSQPLTEQGRSTEAGHPAEMQSLSDYAFAQGCPTNIVEPFLELCCSLRFLTMQPAFSPFPLPKCQTCIIPVWRLSPSCLSQSL